MKERSNCIRGKREMGKVTVLNVYLSARENSSRPMKSVFKQNLMYYVPFISFCFQWVQMKTFLKVTSITQSAGYFHLFVR